MKNNNSPAPQVIVPLLLAAGSSSRMGESKQLLSINGEPLLLRTVKTVLAVGLTAPVIVLGHNYKQHEDVVKHLPIDIITHTHWKMGMGSTLRAGIKFIISRYPKVDAVILLVCDQPYLNSHHISLLAKEFQTTTTSIVASSYKGIMGVPALFSKSLFPELLALDNQQGAKQIIQRHTDRVVAVPFPKGEIDLDTREDYNTFIQ